MAQNSLPYTYYITRNSERGEPKMARYYRYKLPPWARNCIIVIEKVTLPILIFQLIRKLLFPSTLVVFLLGALSVLFIVFFLYFIFSRLLFIVYTITIIYYNHH